MIVHITTDHPDAQDAGKSAVIRSLVALAGEFDHRVYSLNRIACAPARLLARAAARPWRPDFPVKRVGCDAALVTLTYEAPGRGVYHRSALESVADWIADDLARTGERPELIVGHKLTMEGIVASRVAARFGIPFALSIQGNTDRRILAARPDLAGQFRRIFHDAAVVFPFTPWALAAVEQRLGKRTGSTLLLPCPTDQDAILTPRIIGPKLISAFHLRHRKLKNADLLIAAAAKLQAQGEAFELAILGGGEAADVAALQQAIDRAGAAAVTLAGPVAHADMQARMNASAGYVMVSRRESFGLVFIEALLAGCPIVYPKDAAVDGYFDGCDFAIGVPQGDVEACADAMQRLVRDEARLKASLADWLRTEAPRRFQRAAIAAQFTHGLRLAAQPPSPAH